ncbi:MAG: hypothetical protein NVSMB45_15840 [Ginsengibacter sp.]
MKSLIILFLASFLALAGMAQKGKSTNVKINTTSKQVIYACPDHPDMISNQPGKCPKCNMDLNLSKKETMKMDQLHVYTCNMDPNIHSVKPGSCPKCGMRLTEDKIFEAKIKRKGT